MESQTDLIRTDNSTQLTAITPPEMLSAQGTLIEWCDIKIRELKKDSSELKESVDHAKKSKWKFTTIERHYKIALRRISYYEKIKEALLHGYYIVPNFPVDMFAIRTKRDFPKPDYSTSYWDSKTESEQELKIGEGEYKNPFPLVSREKRKDVEGKEHYKSYAVAFDAIDFPITMAKPNIMVATTDAMAFKCFDRFGILPGRSRSDDPLIVGQIVFNTTKWREKVATFMIAWHLDTNTL